MKYYESLDKLASNYYYNKYPATFKKTSTGLTSDQCNAALSPEVQEYFQTKKQGLFSRIAQKVKKTTPNPT